jgi:tetratricopeptide (TPR) repeat protein
MTDHSDVFDQSLAAPGFIKTGSRAEIPGDQRAALIRRGNEFFNAGKYEEAKRIFLTTRYTDGLMRLGDYYYKKQDTLEAFRMYWLAPDHRKTDYLVERMAAVVRSWLKEEG